MSDGNGFRRGHLVVVLSGVALIGLSFVPLWATYRVPGLGLVAPATSHQNAWTAYGLTMQLALGLAVVAAMLAGVALVSRSQRAANAELFLAGLCSAVTLLLLWQLVRGPQGSSDPSGYGIERGLLSFVGAGLAVVMTYGSYLGWKPGRRGGFGDDVRKTAANRPSLGE